jgi:16S rRNA (adenine1518-N6/adenine1519-N6)-dimethyltransferase
MRNRFGQHFLRDPHVIQSLVDRIAPEQGQCMVEIGPGQGALTVPILEKVGRLDVVELDRDLIPTLKMRCADKGDLVVHQADALKFDFSNLVQAGCISHPVLRVIGNLPYNISTPLIFHLLNYTVLIADMHFMLQKEVVDRLAAQPGMGEYGRLSIMVQYHCQVTSLFNVPPSAFYPVPKVESSVVRLVPYQAAVEESLDKVSALQTAQSLCLTMPSMASSRATTLSKLSSPVRRTFPVAQNYLHFSLLVREAFSHRRKTLRNSLKNQVRDEEWSQMDINPKLRPEELRVEDYIYISNRLQQK